MGLLVSQLNNYTLSPITEDRVSEAAGVNSAGRLVRALVRAGLRRRDHAGHSVVRLHAGGGGQQGARARQQEQVADALEHDAEVVTNTALTEQLAGQPADVQAEIIRINTDTRPIALQVAMLIPLLAALLGLFNSFRMLRQPDPTPSNSGEGLALG
jgi:hypothetical protein